MCFPRVSARFLATAVTLVCLTGCDRHGLDIVNAPEFDDTFTFESGLEDWTARGRDLTNPTDLWEVVPSADRASDGAKSVRLHLESVNSQGKIWIERKYSVEKDQIYTVYVAFDFGSADFGSVNLWQMLVGAAPASPATATAPVPSAVGDTGNGQPTDQGFKFARKTFTTEAKSDADGNLFVYAGVWGTSPFSRNYYVDKLEVVLTRKGLSKPI